MWEYKVHELTDGINDIWLGAWNSSDNSYYIEHQSTTLLQNLTYKLYL